MDNCINLRQNQANKMVYDILLADLQRNQPHKNPQGIGTGHIPQLWLSYIREQKYIYFKV